MIRKLIPALLSATIALAAQSCEDNGTANSTAHARDGVTMFVNAKGQACSGNTKWCAQTGNGKLRFAKTYRPYPDGPKRACEWSLYVVHADGKTLQKGRGGWPAKIYVSEPETVHVFLRSQDCGVWK